MYRNKWHSFSSDVFLSHRSPELAATAQAGEALEYN